VRLNSHRRARRGAVLVTYGMMFFALLGVAALVIDLGFARLTQQQMQSAADSAAIEGVRNRDPDSGEPDRQFAADLVSIAFDNDLDPANGDPRDFGAGPVFQLSGGIGGDLYASQQLSLAGNPTARVYKPQLARNADNNEPHGDIVRGTFIPGQFVDESPVYGRSDFTPATDGDSLLVRLRRTSDFAGLDNVPGVSTSGPTLPFLFGRGTLISSDPNGPYNPRRDGITVRATAIAQAVPAKTVGPVNVANTVQGITPFALRRADWVALGAAAVPLTVGTGGSVALANGTVVGQSIDSTKGLTVGQRVDDRIATALPASFVTDPALFVMVPLYDNDLTPTGVRWVVGFGLVKITGTTASEFTVQRMTGGTRVTGETEPLRNLSGASLQQVGNAIPTDIPSATLDELFRRNRALAPGTAPADTGPFIALAPVLVR